MCLLQEVLSCMIEGLINQDHKFIVRYFRSNSVSKSKIRTGIKTIAHNQSEGFFFRAEFMAHYAMK